jgi:hypothetical protein
MANTGYGTIVSVVLHADDLLGYALHVRTPKMGRFMLFEISRWY